jgi:hypothetical protein
MHSHTERKNGKVCEEIKCNVNIVIFVHSYDIITDVSCDPNTIPTLSLTCCNVMTHSCQLTRFSRVIHAFCLFTRAVFFTRRVHTFQDFARDYTHFRKNEFPVFSCTTILGIFPSLCFCRSSLMPMTRFANGFFCTCHVSL